MQSDEPWSPKQMRARLERQAKRLGSSPNACMIAGGVDTATLRKLANHSPTLETLLGLAKGFRISLGQVLGIEPDPTTARQPCDPRTLRVVLELVAAALQEKDPACDLMPFIDGIAALTAPAYSMLDIALRADPNALSNAAVLSIIVNTLKAELAKNDDSRS